METPNALGFPFNLSRPQGGLRLKRGFHPFTCLLSQLLAPDRTNGQCAAWAWTGKGGDQTSRHAIGVYIFPIHESSI